MNKYHCSYISPLLIYIVGLEDNLWLWDTVFRHAKPSPNQLAQSVFPSIAELVEKLFGCDILQHQTLEVNLVGVRTLLQTLLFS